MSLKVKNNTKNSADINDPSCKKKFHLSNPGQDFYFNIQTCSTMKKPPTEEKENLDLKSGICKSKDTHKNIPKRLPMKDITTESKSEVNIRNAPMVASNKSKMTKKTFSYGDLPLIPEESSELTDDSLSDYVATFDFSKMKHVISRNHDDTELNLSDFSFFKDGDENASFLNDKESKLPPLNNNIIEIKTERSIIDNVDVTNCETASTPINSDLQSYLQARNIKGLLKNKARLSHRIPKILNEFNSCSERLNIALEGIDFKRAETILTRSSEKNKINLNTQQSGDYELKRKGYKSPLVAGIVYLDVRENYVPPFVLYSKTYLIDIIKYQLVKETEYNVSEDFLRDTIIKSSNRSIVINWLIKLQAYMKTEHMTVHTAVRLMDQTLDSADFPLKTLQLIALASYWLSLKYYNSEHKEIYWMIKQTGEVYTRKQLLLMEQYVYEANRFDLNTTDLTVYVHYYILNLRITNANIISQCSHYLLDCALLDVYFVHTRPSRLAAGAVYSALVLMKQYDKSAWSNLRHYSGYYPESELEPIKVNIIEIFKNVNDPSFPCREAYYKYSSGRYCNVTHILSDALFSLNDYDCSYNEIYEKDNSYV